LEGWERQSYLSRASAFLFGKWKAQLKPVHCCTRIGRKGTLFFVRIPGNFMVLFLASLQENFATAQSSF
jgi:hypothetical protein